MRNGRGSAGNNDNDSTTVKGRNQQGTNGCGANCTVNGTAAQTNADCPCGTDGTNCGTGGRGGRQRNSASET